MPLSWANPLVSLKSLNFHLIGKNQRIDLKPDDAPGLIAAPLPKMD